MRSTALRRYRFGALEGGRLDSANGAFEPLVSARSLLPAFGSRLIHTSGAAASIAKKNRIIIRSVILCLRVAGGCLTISRNLTREYRCGTSDVEGWAHSRSV